MEATLQQQAERYLGWEIEPSEWDKAKSCAERKLKLIIDREGDGDGLRREPWNLAQLIAETVRDSRLSRFTVELIYLLRQMDEEMGVKKDSPYLKTRAAHQRTPIV